MEGVTNPPFHFSIFSYYYDMEGVTKNTPLSFLTVRIPITTKWGGVTKNTPLSFIKSFALKVNVNSGVTKLKPLSFLKVFQPLRHGGSD